MSAEIISMDDARAERFHESLKSICRRRPDFDVHVEVDFGHLEEKVTDPIRLVLGKERIASLIRYGDLNLDRSKVYGQVEIALEGYFKNFSYTDLNSGELKTKAKLPVRVIIRERNPRHLVVTVYPDRSLKKKKTLKEIPDECWDD